MRRDLLVLCRNGVRGNEARRSAEAAAAAVIYYWSGVGWRVIGMGVFVWSSATATTGGAARVSCIASCSEPWSRTFFLPCCMLFKYFGSFCEECEWVAIRFLPHRMNFLFSFSFMPRWRGWFHGRQIWRWNVSSCVVERPIKRGERNNCRNVVYHHRKQTERKLCEIREVLPDVGDPGGVCTWTLMDRGWISCSWLCELAPGTIWTHRSSN